MSVPLPTDRPQRGAGTGQVPTPEAVGHLWTEAELLPFPGTPAGTAGLSSPQESPGGPRQGREGTGPAVQHGTTTEPLGPSVSAGTTEQAAGREQPNPVSLGGTSAGTPAPVEADTDPAATHPPGTDPVGHGTSEGATAVQGTLPHSPPSATVSGPARGQQRPSSTLVGWRAIGTALVQSQDDTLQLGDSSPGTRPSTLLATDSSAPGTTGTSPFAGGLQRLLTPTGTLQRTHWGLSGGEGFASHPREGPRSAPRPSALSLGPGEGPLGSTAWPALGTGPALLPATRRGSAVPLPMATRASTPGVTSPRQRGALDLTTGVSGPPEREGPPEPSHIPLSPSAIPGQPPGPLAPGSTPVAQGGVTHGSPGSSHIPLSPQSAPASGSAVTLLSMPLSTPLPSPGTSLGVLGFSPTVGTPLGDPSPGLPHSSSRVSPGLSRPSLGETQVGVGSLAPPSAPGPPQQPALSQPVSSLGPTLAIGVTTTTVTATITAATSPERLGDVGTVTAEPRAAQVPTVMPGPPQQPTDSHGGGPGSPPAAVDTEMAQPSSSPRGRTDTDPPQVTPVGVGRAPQVFIVEDQPPLLRGESEVSGSSAGARQEGERR